MHVYSSMLNSTLDAFSVNAVYVCTLSLNSNPPFFLSTRHSFSRITSRYNATLLTIGQFTLCINIVYYNMNFMSQILFINVLVDWSLSGIMTSKLVFRESESPRPAALSILISRMTSSSVIIPYIMPVRHYGSMR